MPSHKSSVKRVKQTKVKTLRNRAIRSTGRTAVKKVREAIEKGDKDAAAKALVDATRELHSSVTKGSVHKNNAARRISRLAKQVNKLSA